MIAITLLALALQAPTVCLSGNDPLELIAGRESPGRAGITADFEGYTYRFIHEENKVRFLGDPERYAVQIGGACGNMGPLSGRGSASRWTVHDGRIWLFASEACRKSFLSQPSAYVDRAEPGLQPTPLERAAGLKSMSGMVDGLGGPKAVGAIRWIVWAERTPYTAPDGSARAYVVEHGFAHPNGFMRRELWQGGGVHMLVRGESGWLDVAKRTPMGRSEREYLCWQVVRHPLVAACLRDRPGFQVLGSTPGQFRASYEGATIAFALGSSGLPKEARFRARSGGPYLPVTREFRDWRTVGGVQAPIRWRSQFEGKAAQEKDIEVRINDVNDAALFEPPAK